ncbi:MAG TPA: NDP-sugar synthase [Acidimicrobiales bacterium]|jgi:mannose-1-phosphate guanylyltransferase|nr:NDP-sugar synthase [Acidimicrobiales bacterium]
MKAIVLVGGKGTRLRPLTLSTPKPMLPIVDVPMIERIVDHLARHDIDEVVLSLGYRPDAFVDAFPEGAIRGVKLAYAVEPEPLDTAGGIAFAARAAGLDVGDERFVVVNGDVLTDLDLTALVAFHDERGAEATIALTPVENPAAFGVVPTHDDGRVIAFIEPPDAVKKGLEQPKEPPPTNLINAGFYVFEPRVIARIPENRKVHLETVVFPAMAESGSLYAQGSDEYWLDTGTAALYIRANLDIVAGLRSTIDPVAPGASQRNDGTWTGDGPVLDGAVESPAFIGDAAYVASGATVSRSVVGAGARVEKGAVVDGSVLLPGALVRSGAVVRDSIVGPEAVIGAGADLTDVCVVEGGASVADGVALRGERVEA